MNEEPPTCAACDGPLTLLGTLGRTLHFRCRDCGIDSHRPAAPDVRYAKFLKEHSK